MSDLLDYADDLDRMAGDAMRRGDNETAQRRLEQSKLLREINPLFLGELSEDDPLDTARSNIVTLRNVSFDPEYVRQGRGH